LLWPDYPVHADTIIVKRKPVRNKALGLKAMKSKGFENQPFSPLEGEEK
jgi:hypothetical protein